MFVFRILAFPLAPVEKQEGSKCAATEFFYEQDGTIGEIPMLCAECGA